MSSASFQIDMVGQRFGRLVVTSFAPEIRKVQGTFWFCQCDCGISKPINGTSLRAGRILSCGCLQKEVAARIGARSITHGFAHKIPEYRTWVDMRRRCDTPSQTSYKRYGALGVRVCEKWDKSFLAFYNDVGPKPTPKHTLDRINPYGNYEPGNCRWATAKEQANNQKRHWDARHQQPESAAQ